MKKKIAFFIDSLGGGGAERVLSVISSELADRGYDVDIVMLKKEPIAYSMNSSIRLLYAPDMKVTTVYGRMVKKAFELWSRFRFRVYIPILRRLGKKDYAKANETSFYFYSTFALPYREYLKKEKPSTVFGFLIRSNICMLMAAKETGVKTVFCERNNPVRPDMPKNIIKIRDSIYSSCSEAVFQTAEERDYYKKLHCKTAVILNPLKENLPDRYTGIRRHEIVNFCRLNTQKNIPLLIDAFALFSKDYPDYTLRVYGKGTEKENLEKYIKDKKLEDKVFIQDFAPDVHERIKDAAMFVSTSDFEGLSNSMIEAMAIGLPCVCTDCDGGGARMVIKDHENGLLVAKGDVQEVYKGMHEIAGNLFLSNKLSVHASTLKENLKLKNIVDQWEDLIKETGN